MQEQLATLAKDQAWSARVKSGSCFQAFSSYTAVGLPVISARLVYPVLKLDSPAFLDDLSHGRKANAYKLAVVIGKQVAAGMEIHLSPVDPVLDRSAIPK